jgi:exosortase
MAGPWSIILPAVIALSSAPLLYLHADWMWHSPQYEYFPLIPLGIAALAWQRLPSLGQLTPGAMPVFLGFMGIAAALQALAIVIFSPPIAMVALLVAALGLVYGLGGRTLTATMFPVWLFAWFMVPLPFNWDDKLVTSLQGVTAEWSSRLLDTFGIMHLLEGNTVALPGKKLFVEEACSGVQSLFACLAATAFYVVWSHYGYWRSILLLMAAFGWVLVANATRVVVMTWLTTIKIDVLEGIPHTLLGVAVFAVTLMMMFSTDRLLEFFLSHRNRFWRRRASQGQQDEPTQFMPLNQTLLGSWAAIPLVAVYGVLLVMQLGLMVPVGGEAQASTIDGEPASFAKFSRDSLPPAWAGRPISDFGTDVDRVFKSVHSRYWTYGVGRNRMYASMDFPFSKWHDLAICYRGLGWSVYGKNYHEPTGPNDIPSYTMEMDQKPLGYAYLVFFLFEVDGKPMTPTSDDFLADVGDRLVERAGHMHTNWQAGGRQLSGADGTSYVQLQVFVSSLSPITEAERTEAGRLFKFLHGVLVKSNDDLNGASAGE